MTPLSKKILLLFCCIMGPQKAQAATHDGPNNQDELIRLRTLNRDLGRANLQQYQEINRLQQENQFQRLGLTINAVTIETCFQIFVQSQAFSAQYRQRPADAFANMDELSQESNAAQLKIDSLETLNRKKNIAIGVGITLGAIGGAGGMYYWLTRKPKTP